MKTIPPFKLTPEPLSEAARNMPKFKWAGKEVGTRHQLGGEPAFLQNVHWPDCPSGHGKMTFYAQPIRSMTTSRSQTPGWFMSLSASTALRRKPLLSPVDRRSRSITVIATGSIAMPTFPLTVLYSQIAVLDTAITNLFNDWTDRHVKQGFAWREGSVSFATLEGGGKHQVEVVVTSEDVELSPEAARIIQVPFKSTSGTIEIASISDEASVDLPAGMYSLRFECFPAQNGQEPKVRLVFRRTESPTFEVLRADPELSLDGELLLTASPA